MAHAAADSATTGQAGLSLSSAAYWPMGLVEAFALRMAGHGHSVSVSMMVADRHYAIDQLEHAHTLADEHLHGLAMELFRHYERLPLR
jgi:hypothetical protein